MNRLLSLRQLWAVSVVACGALGQQPQPERFAFDLAAQFAGPQDQRVPTRDLGDHPVQVRAADYNPAYVRRNLVPLMRRSVAIGDMDGNGIPGLYIAVDGRPDLLLKGA